MNVTTLWEARDKITQAWPFDVQNYPAIDRVTNPLVFSLKHVAEHQMKALGRLVTELEPYDHGTATMDVLDNAKASEAAETLFVNAFRTLELLGIDPEAAIQSYLAKHPGRHSTRTS